MVLDELHVPALTAIAEGVAMPAAGAVPGVAPRPTDPTPAAGAFPGVAPTAIVPPSLGVAPTAIVPPSLGVAPTAIVLPPLGVAPTAIVPPPLGVAPTAIVPPSTAVPPAAEPEDGAIQDDKHTAALAAPNTQSSPVVRTSLRVIGASLNGRGCLSRDAQRMKNASKPTCSGAQTDLSSVG